MLCNRRKIVWFPSCTSSLTGVVWGGVLAGAPRQLKGYYRNMDRLSNYRLLPVSFDVYGTLIDWESGVLTGLKPLLDSNGANFSQEHLLTVYHELERTQQNKTPNMGYAELPTTIYPQIAARLGLPAPSVEQNKAFGDSIRK